MKLIVDGSFIIQDESGQKETAKPGDLFYFPKGSVITFSTPDFGVGFFCEQKGEDEALSGSQKEEHFQAYPGASKLLIFRF